MFLVALICVSLSVLSVRCQPTVDSETCSVRSSSFSEALHSAVSEFRQASQEQRLELLHLQQNHHEKMLNLTEKLEQRCEKLLNIKEGTEQNQQGTPLNLTEQWCGKLLNVKEELEQKQREELANLTDTLLNLNREMVEKNHEELRNLTEKLEQRYEKRLKIKEEAEQNQQGTLLNLTEQLYEKLLNVKEEMGQKQREELTNMTETLLNLNREMVQKNREELLNLTEKLEQRYEKLLKIKEGTEQNQQGTPLNLTEQWCGKLLNVKEELEQKQREELTNLTETLVKLNRDMVEKNHEELRNLTEELKSFMRNLLVVPVNTWPGHEQQRANCSSAPVLIQQHLVGGGSFNLSWQEYKVGFGTPDSNYWIGNDRLHSLTRNNIYKLRIELQQKSTLNWYWAEYQVFIVDNEASRYRLTVRRYSGNTGDALHWHNGQKFSTYDRDNDRYSSNCAAIYGGGFWFNDCGFTCLNGIQFSIWHGLPDDEHLHATQMWLMC